MLSSVLAGFGLGLSLIVAIGAQNLFVLRQGIRREHVLLVAAICAVSDAVLIVLGVSGVGFVLQAVPWLIDAVRWAGAAFLIAYGLLAAKRAWRPSGDVLDVGAEASVDPSARPAHEPPSARPAQDTPSQTTEGPASRRHVVQTAARTAALPVVLTCLALTWLNPHVYLDTVFLLGTVANTHDARWLFALGAATASVVWFFGLAFGARYLSRWLSTPRAWRVLDAVIAVVMIVLGVSLVLPH
ncbi:amino acid transporter [Microbacterium sp. 4R-513]|uniref:LysE/ArgO family amino acid transporter n=1 Tax=Microbacterium sp. 4R-513 TaxID=2567934 RepID=UPI0013E17C9B|nr:LysE/ArgO family amino acid transporter [Microbacterium sp. 4R-513]QIG39828.1 amino acid transporter [Microbacterium sp. 4R-513]